jgi:hypothetical protein
MEKVIFFNVGWMERYQGNPEQESIKGGGKFVDKNGYGYEMFNFLPFNGERSLVLRLLNRRVGDLPETVQAQVEALPLERMETLALDLLDFTSLADLESWLN